MKLTDSDYTFMIRVSQDAVSPRFITKKEKIIANKLIRLKLISISDNFVPYYYITDEGKKMFSSIFGTDD